MMTSDSTGDLLRQAAEQLTALVRDEIRLAKLELQAKAKHAGRAAGLFAAAALSTAYAVGALLIAGGLGLALVLPGWATALIVAAVLLAAAGLSALAARQQMRKAAEATLQQTMRGLRADVAVVTSSTKTSSLDGSLR